ncbi:hypothetical protein ONZ45_g14577 [Pleurotus djamor]|nr:hypothetical protein ONZ45_g14577 [Pleurotus djamor]
MFRFRPSASMPDLGGDVPRAPQPKLEEPSETTRRKIDEFFMFHDFDKDPLFNCPHGTEGGRNLVLCIDGTANQFSAQSSNIIEIYSRLIKLAGVQLTFYNSGIGTYAKPSFRSWKYFKQVVEHAVDTAIAWNFESIVHAAYKWLSETYEPGDRIFMFGFSRGAYQVRVIAGMIEKVGLLHKGSDNQIPFAYELYASVTSSSRRNLNDEDKSVPNVESAEDVLCHQFKRTLCHEDVKVHFVGAWDTVSSIGLLRGKSLPETVSGMGHVCSFRHALALDERRVKFQPEYVNGGLGPHEGNSRGDVKEVWFAGTHSDVYVLLSSAPKISLGPSLRWMMQEAMKRGLHLKPITKAWEPLPLTKSLEWFWLPLEILPIKSLSYRNEDQSTWRPHLYSGRRVQPGQRIHQSVLMRRQSEGHTYVPNAVCPKEFLNWGEFFKQYSHSPPKKGSIIELDPLENVSSCLSSLREACEAYNRSGSSSGSTQYVESMIALRSFLEGPNFRQSSVNEIPDAGRILLSAVRVALQHSDGTDSNTPDTRETLIRLLAMLELRETKDNPLFKPSDVKQWATTICPKYRPDFVKVASSLACMAASRALGRVNKIAFSVKEQAWIILTNKSVAVWNGSDQNPEHRISISDTVITWQVSCDGSHIAVADGWMIQIIDISTQPPLVFKCVDTTEPNGYNRYDILSLCFSDDVQTLVSGDAGNWIKLWRREGSQWKVSRRFKGGDSGIYDLAFSRDGSHLASKARWEPIQVWRFGVDADVVVDLEDSSESWSLAWSPSGDRIASGTTNSRVKIWRTDSGNIEHTFTVQDVFNHRIRCLAFGAGGRVLATGSDDHQIRIWRCDTWEKIWEFEISEWVTSMAFSPDGKRLVSGGMKDALHLWDVDNGDEELVK